MSVPIGAKVMARCNPIGLAEQWRQYVETHPPLTVQRLQDALLELAAHPLKPDFLIIPDSTVSWLETQRWWTPVRSAPIGLAQQWHDYVTKRLRNFSRPSSESTERRPGKITPRVCACGHLGLKHYTDGSCGHCGCCEFIPMDCGAHYIGFTHI